MSVFILNIASNVKPAYDNFLTDRAATATALGNLNTELAAMPIPPVDVVADSDWNNYVTAYDTWAASVATLQGLYHTAIATQRAAELLVIVALGYNSGDDDNSLCLDQWVQVTGAGGGILTYTNWIGASRLSTYLTISTTLPTRIFPNT